MSAMEMALCCDKKMLAHGRAVALTHLVRKNITVVLSFEQGKGKLIFVYYAVLQQCITHAQLMSTYSTVCWIAREATQLDQYSNNSC